MDIEERKARYIGKCLSYACEYWAEHLSRVSPMESGVEELIGVLRKLVAERLLYWMEVLSLLGKLSVVVTSLAKVRTWLLVRLNLLYVASTFKYHL